MRLSMTRTDREGIDLEALMRETALRLFEARTDGLNFTKIKGVGVVTQQIGNKLTADVNYNAEYEPQIMSLVGPDTYSISDSQRAIVITASYISINLVFQTSTPQEIDKAFTEVMSDISTPLRLY